MRKVTWILVGAIALAMGCGKGQQHAGKGRKSNEHASRETPRKAAPRKVALPRVAPLPQPGPDGMATKFPPIVVVPAPPELADKLSQLEQDLLAKNYKRRNEARKALRSLVKEHARDMALARYLVARKSFDMVSSGINILRRLRNHPDFLGVAVSLLGHASDRVRSSAVSLVAYGLKPGDFAKVVPFLLKLWKDQSCVVRRMALSALVINRQRMQRGGSSKALASVDAAKLLSEALKDECPAVRAYAMRNVKMLAAGKEPDPAVVSQLKEAATKSPYYLEMCAAMLGLGQLKVKGVERILAKGLDMAVVPSLTVYYVSDRVPYTFTNHGSMPACAADALAALTGKMVSGKPVERVAAWRKEMAAKGYCKKAPARMCLGRRDCKDQEEVCLAMQCTPKAKAADAYWKLQELRHCMPKPDPKAKWKNFVDEAALQAGFGLHWDAPWRIRDFLRKKDVKAFQKKEEEIKAKACPKAAKGK